MDNVLWESRAVYCPSDITINRHKWLIFSINDCSHDKVMRCLSHGQDCSLNITYPIHILCPYSALSPAMTALQVGHKSWRFWIDACYMQGESNPAKIQRCRDAVPVIGRDRMGPCEQLPDRWSGLHPPDWQDARLVDMPVLWHAEQDVHRKAHPFPETAHVALPLWEGPQAQDQAFLICIRNGTCLWMNGRCRFLDIPLFTDRKYVMSVIKFFSWQQSCCLHPPPKCNVIVSPFLFPVAIIIVRAKKRVFV